MTLKISRDEYLWLFGILTYNDDVNVQIPPRTIIYGDEQKKII